MKNSANPIVSDATGLILEYPTDLLPLTSSNSLSHSIKVDEIFDQGHRHFSSFHWLYPGVFHPHLSSSLLQATKATMTKKIQSGGGHTGWSAAWEISLWSRLRESQSTEKAMKKLLSKYVTRNLFGLHPKLAPNKQNCVTCYGPFSSSQIPHGDTEHRGMTTADASVFQMDANSGMAAGLHEMIYQSHIPSLLIFLPTIIPELSSGRVRNLASRGGYFVTFSWSSSRIQHISLNFQYWHPWFLPQYENFPGFFSTNQKTEQFTSSSVQFPVTENILTLVTPNPLEKIVFQPLHCGLVVERQQSDIPSHVTSPLDSYTHLKIQMFPCQVFLCSHDEILECRI